MRILSVIAQKPLSTGSGIYLSETMRSFHKLGHKQALIYGRMPEDTLPDNLNFVDKTYSVDFKSDSLPFSIAGMSDIMPYESTRYVDFDDEMTAIFKKNFERRIKDALCEFKPDVVICHHLYLLSALTSDIVKEINATIKLVAICHGTDLRQLKKHALEKEYIVDGIQKFDEIFALHSNQVNEISTLFKIDNNKIHVLGCGYNSQIFSSENIAQNKDSIIFVGKICKAKGFLALIYALKKYSKIHSNVELLAVGGHSDEKQYSKIVDQAKKMPYKITFTGAVNQEKLAEFYAKSHIFCLPSYFEGLPLVPIEAMACGCVAICTSLPGIQEWYEESCPTSPILFCSPPRMKDVDTPLAGEEKKFERSLYETLLKAREMRGEMKSVSHLSWDNLTKNLLDHLNV